MKTAGDFLGSIEILQSEICESGRLSIIAGFGKASVLL
jgi:hypothetical protein